MTLFQATNSEHIDTILHKENASFFSDTVTPQHHIPQDMLVDDMGRSIVESFVQVILHKNVHLFPSNLNIKHFTCGALKMQMYQLHCTA